MSSAMENGAKIIVFYKKKTIVLLALYTNMAEINFYDYQLFEYTFDDLKLVDVQGIHSIKCI